ISCATPQANDGHDMRNQTIFHDDNPYIVEFINPRLVVSGTAFPETKRQFHVLGGDAALRRCFIRCRACHE
ncbi:MAG: hypothetical protein ACR2OE_09790, partial [Thermomicrobiales bacterium]